MHLFIVSINHHFLNFINLILLCLLKFMSMNVLQLSSMFLGKYIVCRIEGFKRLCWSSGCGFV